MLAKPRKTPTNLFTGFLGVGKTTAILDLLQQKPANEKWAVLVNEFGEVGIDGAILEGGSPEGVSVREIGGGCFCCTTAPYLPVALHFLFLDAKPDRLIIETSGLGHPAGIVDTLRANYSDRLQLNATIGLVAPADFTCDGMLENPIFRDQVQLADVLVLNKADTTTPAVIEQFQAWANSLFPPKLLIVSAVRGHLDPSWLNLNRRQELLPTLGFAPPHAHEAVPEPSLNTAMPGKPVRYLSPGGRACGWVFHPDDQFEEEALLELFSRNTAITRLKGVFHLKHEWVVIQRVGGTLSVNVTAYRRDSRVEVFVETESFNWQNLEDGLKASFLEDLTPTPSP